jgi:HK97 family phage major capsid protein
VPKKGVSPLSDYLKRLNEARQSAWEQGKALLDAAAAENRDLTAEEQVSYDKINADIDGMAQRATSLIDAEQRNKDATEAFEKLLGGQSGEQRKARSEADEFRAFARGESGKSYEAQPESRDLTKGTATAGGNTVPTSFYDQLWEHMIEVSGVLNAGPTLLRTTSGENIEIPVTTAHSTAALTAEAALLAESDPAFAKRTLGAYKYGMSVQVASELVSDSGVDLLGYLSRQAGRAVGNALGVDLVTGNGTAKPSGIVQTASTGVTGGAGVAGAFTADNLIDLYFSVIAPYRNSSSCGWLMKDATLANVRKLKDTTNQYLWQPSIQVGQPDTLLGKPVHTDPNVAAVGLSAKSVIFGDVAAYFVRLAGGIRFERSDDFAFQNDLVTFRCIVRGDGILADQTGAVKVFAGAAT